MTAPSPRPRITRRITPLPELADQRVPAWRFTRLAALWICAIVVGLAVSGLIMTSLVTMKVTVSGSGILEPASIWSARSLESGVLERVLVRTGDEVRAGQPVAILDSLETSSQLADLRVQLRATRIDANHLERSSVIQSALAGAQLQSADARVARARTALRLAMVQFQVNGDPDSVARAMSERVHVGLDSPSADLLAAESDATAAHTQVRAADLASFDVDRRRADADRIDQQLRSADARLARLAIRAPASGVVLTDQVELLRGVSV